jgi:hypothetical protein
LRGAGFGQFPKEEVARSGEGVSEKEIKKESPEMPHRNTGSAVE